MHSNLFKTDSFFLALLRSVALLAIVFGHTGGFTFFEPYSEFLRVAVPIFFFISGAVSCFSYGRSKSCIGFYIKRICGLLLPYYLFCGVVFGTYVLHSASVPSITMRGVLQWIVVSPANAAMPFPVGQIWFLKVLLVLVVFTPTICFVNNTYRFTLLVIMGLLLLFPGIGQFVEIEAYFKISYFNFFLPLVYGSFYIFGIVYFTGKKEIFTPRRLVVMAFFFLSAGVALLQILPTEVNFAKHVFPPDLYYVVCSFFVLFIILATRHLYVSTLEKNRTCVVVVGFIHRHTLSIFLLHTFAQHVVRLPLVHYFDVRSNLFWIVQFLATSLLTGLMAVPFTRIHTLLGRRIIAFICSNKAGCRVNNRLGR